MSEQLEQNEHTAIYDERMRGIIDRVRTELMERDAFAANPEMVDDLKAEFDEAWSDYERIREEAVRTHLQADARTRAERTAAFRRQVKGAIAKSERRLQAMVDALDAMAADDLEAMFGEAA